MSILGPRYARKKYEADRPKGEPPCPPTKAALARRKAEAFRDLLELEKLAKGTRDWGAGGK